MLEPTGGNIADPVTDGVSDADPDRDEHAVRDTVALTDHVAVDRAAERSVRNGRVGARWGNPPLPLVGPRRYVD
jgi:hypothetical protein